MAQFGVYRDAYFWLNGIDYSSQMRGVAINYSAEMLDDTAMGDTTRSNTGGLKNWSVDANAIQDLSTGGLGYALFDLIGATVCFEIRPRNACSSASNPRFSGIGVVDGGPPQSGEVGTLLMMPFGIQSAGTLSRSVTAS